MTRGALVAAALALLTLLALAGQTAVVARAGFLMGDFQAFYCASRVAVQRNDPYHAEPLRACERSTGLGRFIAKNDAAAVPAPLPGYAIGAFAPLALLPVRVAGALWLLLLIA
ncbi:MAG TPA: hypothetical protein VJP76_07715, partial [Candidatus Tumulicola sp.]|nr:hypothetical protein [Candidatus Tumulicola sp.]